MPPGASAAHTSWPQDSWDRDLLPFHRARSLTAPRTERTDGGHGRGVGGARRRKYLHPAHPERRDPAAACHGPRYRDDHRAHLDQQLGEDPPVGPAPAPRPDGGRGKETADGGSPISLGRFGALTMLYPESGDYECHPRGFQGWGVFAQPQISSRSPGSPRVPQVTPNDTQRHLTTLQRPNLGLSAPGTMPSNPSEPCQSGVDPVSCKKDVVRSGGCADRNCDLVVFRLALLWGL